MTNKIKDVDITNHIRYFFDDIIIQIELEYLKSHTKIFIFTTLDMYDQRFEIRES